jgi:hypothetical protein
VTTIEAAQANIDSLNEQRQLMLNDIESSCESHGLPVEVINDLVANKLPALEAAITAAEASLAAMTTEN